MFRFFSRFSQLLSSRSWRSSSSLLLASTALASTAMLTASFSTEESFSLFPVLHAEKKKQCCHHHESKKAESSSSSSSCCRHGKKTDENDLGLYPPIEPFEHGMLKVSDIHTIYYEVCGNPDGAPVFVIHGGPGGGCQDSYRQYFDPAVYKIVLFDQRGCGRSTPHACLEENTTWDLVSDIERLMAHLNVETSHVFGGSWGSTLSMTFAITHPEKVRSLTLRGIFLCDTDLDFFYQDGSSWLFPDAFDKYKAVIPEEERGNMMEAYNKRLTSEDPAVRLEAAKAWTTWEKKTSKLVVTDEEAETSDFFAEAFARIENHYFVNGAFFPTRNWILDNAHRMADIPTFIVHGRYDVVCPIKNAWELKKRLPNAELVICPTSGHSMGEPAIARELVKATDRFKTL